MPEILGQVAAAVGFIVMMITAVMQHRRWHKTQETSTVLMTVLVLSFVVMIVAVSIMSRS